MNHINSGGITKIKRDVTYQNIHLNSMFRDDYYKTESTNFIYSIPVQLKNIAAISLTSLDIPNSWYIFSQKKKNNLFWVRVSNCSEKQNIFEICIPEGNYDIGSLEDTLNETYFCDSSNENGLQYLRFTINKITLKSEFSITGDTTDNFNYSIKFADENTENVYETAGFILGFRYGHYFEQYGTLRSEGIFDGGGDRYIYFCLEDYNYNTNDNNIICFNGSNMSKNVLGKIYLYNGKFQLNINDIPDNSVSFTKTRQYTGPVDLKKIKISLLDQFGKLIDLNNMDFSFTLQLQILYEKISPLSDRIGPEHSEHGNISFMSHSSQQAIDTLSDQQLRGCSVFNNQAMLPILGSNN